MSKSRKYTREGVQAAVRLAASNDVGEWNEVDARYQEMLVSKGGEELLRLEKACRQLAAQLQQTKKEPFATKADLLEVVVPWKFAKGKARPALWKHLKSNTEESVQEKSRASFQQAKRGNIDEAINAISELKGVGPATASKVLSLYRPDMFAFMDDEVIECLYTGKRGYTMSIYRHVNEECTAIAQKLGQEDWTPCKIGQTLWTAARLAATGSALKENKPACTSRAQKRTRQLPDDATLVTKKTRRR